ncbi:MAG: hypothetical protein KF797_10785, partial [Flavobacteriales bacterium]|nr:hypothetical protein [Flavobacteriales bacterium]
MTKFYIPLLALALAGGSASAQQSHDRPLTKQKAITAPTVPNTRTPRASVNRVNREIIWSDDFSNPGNWIAGTIGTASSDTWVIGTTGPTGAYASQVGTIASSTAANGFALFDSDLLCSGNQEATLTIANPVDLSDWTAGVLLQFEQNYKRFYDNVWVDWSTNGTDWTPVQVNADMEHGGDAAATTNPQLTTVDLSDLAGSSTAYFRFRFESTPTSVNPATGGAYPGTLVGCAYSWMVDDVAFTTLPDYEVIMDFAFASMTAEGDEYGQVPASQMPGTLNVGASIINFGLGNQGNVDLHVTFYDEDDNAVPGFSTVIPVGTIPSRETADVSVDINVPFDLPIGIYTGRFTLTGDEIDLDEDPSDNELSRSFAISTDVYALDGFGVHPEGSEDTRIYGSASFADNSEVYLMTMYTINTQTTATGLHVELVGSPYTVPGADAEIEAFIYADVAQITSETGGVIEGGPVNHALNNITSGTHAITAADVTAGMVYLAFSQPVSLAPGT